MKNVTIKKEIKNIGNIDKLLIWYNVEKTINFDLITNEKNIYDPNWPHIPDHTLKILIIGGLRSGIYKIWVTTNLILIKKCKTSIWVNHEQTSQKYLKDPKVFVEYSSSMNDVYKTIEDYNPNKKCQIFIVFDDMIVDMLSKENE